MKVPKIALLFIVLASVSFTSMAYRGSPPINHTKEEAKATNIETTMTGLGICDNAALLTFSEVNNVYAIAPIPTKESAIAYCGFAKIGSKTVSIVTTGYIILKRVQPYINLTKEEVLLLNKLPYDHGLKIA